MVGQGTEHNVGWNWRVVVEKLAGSSQGGGAGWQARQTRRVCLQVEEVGRDAWAVELRDQTAG